MKTEAELYINQHAIARFQLVGYWPGAQAIRGFKLEPGDVLEKDDVYDSTNGNWEPCMVPGLTLGDGVTTVWIRPEK